VRGSTDDKNVRHSGCRLFFIKDKKKRSNDLLGKRRLRSTASHAGRSVSPGNCSQPVG